MALRDRAYSIEYISIATESYLMVLPHETGQIIDYQLKMASGNKVKCLLAMTCKNINLSLELYYNITSKISLEKYLSRIQFSRKEYILFLLNFVNRIFELKNYLLNETKVLLDVQNIYIEMDTEKVFFTYLPIKDYKNDYCTFFTELIINNSQFIEEPQCDNYLQRIIMLLKSNNFCVAGMKELLERLLKENSTEKANENHHVQSINNINLSEQSACKEMMPSDVMFRINKTSNNEKIRIDKNETASNNIIKELPTSIKIPSKQADTRCSSDLIKTNKLSKHKINKKSYIPKVFFFAGQPLLFVTFYLIVNSGILEESDDYAVSLVILGLIFCALDVLFYRYLKNPPDAILRILNINPSETQENTLSSSIKGNIPMLPSKVKRQQNKQLDLEQLNSFENGQAKSQINRQLNTLENGKANKQSMQKSFINTEGDISSELTKASLTPYSRKLQPATCNGDTEVITMEKSTIPLLRQKIGTDIITLSKPSLIIGRMSGFVDHVLEVNSIGKIHAEITIENGEYFISDLNSKNGTFINEIKIPPNAKAKVVSGDTVRFANVEYVFFS